MWMWVSSRLCYDPNYDTLGLGLYNSCGACHFQCGRKFLLPGFQGKQTGWGGLTVTVKRVDLGRTGNQQPE
jgi:hypothetical protein